MSKARELRELAVEEVEQRINESLKEQFDLRKTSVSGKLENPLQLRAVRREIARLRTVLKEKQDGKEAGQVAHGNSARKA
ncbi:MAG: 50S ribosomal protein L29 [Clostridiales bacterium]|nr:50S ribosomal protein L29 [Clostridiales bacterium]